MSCVMCDFKSGGSRTVHEGVSALEYAICIDKQLSNFLKVPWRWSQQAFPKCW